MLDAPLSRGMTDESGQAGLRIAADARRGHTLTTLAWNPLKIAALPGVRRTAGRGL
jgi:putative NADH-flavin reductase